MQFPYRIQIKYKGNRCEFIDCRDDEVETFKYAYLRDKEAIAYILYLNKGVFDYEVIDYAFKN